MLCAESGGVLDDLIVYRYSDDLLRIVPNAANAATVRDALRAGMPEQIEVADRHDDEGIIAIQGPQSGSVIAALGLLPDGTDLDYMAFGTGSFEGTTAVVCRTGYTGEHGYEVIIGNEALPALWEAVLGHARPCGLGARDTLRTEMGYPLHGQDISPEITPLEAGLSWAVGWDKAEFAGREALTAMRAKGRPRALRGLRVDGRGVPRPHMTVLGADGAGRRRDHLRHVLAHAQGRDRAGAGGSRPHVRRRGRHRRPRSSGGGTPRQDAVRRRVAQVGVAHRPRAECSGHLVTVGARGCGAATCGMVHSRRPILPSCPWRSTAASGTSRGPRSRPARALTRRGHGPTTAPHRCRIRRRRDAGSSSRGTVPPGCTTTSASRSTESWSAGRCRAGRPWTRRPDGWPCMSRTTPWSTSTSRA